MIRPSRMINRLIHRIFQTEREQNIPRVGDQKVAQIQHFPLNPVKTH
jgi:hypothetical protein